MESKLIYQFHLPVTITTPKLIKKGHLPVNQTHCRHGARHSAWLVTQRSALGSVNERVPGSADTFAPGLVCSERSEVQRAEDIDLVLRNGNGSHPQRPQPSGRPVAMG